MDTHPKIYMDTLPNLHGHPSKFTWTPIQIYMDTHPNLHGHPSHQLVKKFIFSVHYHGCPDNFVLIISKIYLLCEGELTQLS
jgi:hypothetical protein